MRLIPCLYFRNYVLTLYHIYCTGLSWTALYKIVSLSFRSTLINDSLNTSLISNNSTTNLVIVPKVIFEKSSQCIKWRRFESRVYPFFPQRVRRELVQDWGDYLMKQMRRCAFLANYAVPCQSCLWRRIVGRVVRLIYFLNKNLLCEPHDTHNYSFIVLAWYRLAGEFDKYFDCVFPDKLIKITLVKSMNSTKRLFMIGDLLVK